MGCSHAKPVLSQQPSSIHDITSRQPTINLDDFFQRTNSRASAVPPPVRKTSSPSIGLSIIESRVSKRSPRNDEETSSQLFQSTRQSARRPSVTLGQIDSALELERRSSVSPRVEEASKQQGRPYGRQSVRRKSVTLDDIDSSLHLTPPRRSSVSPREEEVVASELPPRASRRMSTPAAGSRASSKSALTTSPSNGKRKAARRASWSPVLDNRDDVSATRARRASLPPSGSAIAFEERDAPIVLSLMESRIKKRREAHQQEVRDRQLN